MCRKAGTERHEHPRLDVLLDGRQGRQALSKREFRDAPGVRQRTAVPAGDERIWTILGDGGERPLERRGVTRVLQCDLQAQRRRRALDLVGAR